MSPKSSAESFWHDGYLVVDALVPLEQCAFLRQCMDVSQRSGRMREAKNSAYHGPNNEYAPVAGQSLLRALTPSIAECVGKELLPSYAFWRIYEKGAVLNRHRDRPACEVSVSITLAAEPLSTIWPIWVTDRHGKDKSIALEPGVGLLYQGTQIQHWRMPFSGIRHYQLFLHYVDASGPFAALLHDGGTAQMP